jgi:hypothetical protein
VWVEAKTERERVVAGSNRHVKSDVGVSWFLLGTLLAGHERTKETIGSSERRL